MTWKKWKIRIKTHTKADRCNNTGTSCKMPSVMLHLARATGTPAENRWSRDTVLILLCYILRFINILPALHHQSY